MSDLGIPPNPLWKWCKDPSLHAFPATAEAACESGTARMAERRPEKAETTSGLDLALLAVE